MSALGRSVGVSAADVTLTLPVLERKLKVASSEAKAGPCSSASPTRRYGATREQVAGAPPKGPVQRLWRTLTGGERRARRRAARAAAAAEAAEALSMASANTGKKSLSGFASPDEQSSVPREPSFARRPVLSQRGALKQKAGAASGALVAAAGRLESSAESASTPRSGDRGDRRAPNSRVSFKLAEGSVSGAAGGRQQQQQLVAGLPPKAPSATMSLNRLRPPSAQQPGLATAFSQRGVLGGGVEGSAGAIGGTGRRGPLAGSASMRGPLQRQQERGGGGAGISTGDIVLRIIPPEAGAGGPSAPRKAASALLTSSMMASRAGAPWAGPSASVRGAKRAGSVRGVPPAYNHARTTATLLDETIPEAGVSGQRRKAGASLDGGGTAVRPLQAPPSPDAQNGGRRVAKSVDEGSRSPPHSQPAAAVRADSRRAASPAKQGSAQVAAWSAGFLPSDRQREAARLVSSAFVIAFLYCARVVPARSLAEIQRATAELFESREAALALRRRDPTGCGGVVIKHGYNDLVQRFRVMLATGGNLFAKNRWLRRCRVWRLVLLMDPRGFWDATEGLAGALLAQRVLPADVAHLKRRGGAVNGLRNLLVIAATELNDHAGEDVHVRGGGVPSTNVAEEAAFCPVSDFPLDAIEWSMPPELRRLSEYAGKSPRKLKTFSPLRIWTTVLCTAALRRADESFLVETVESGGFDETIVDRSMQWLAIAVRNAVPLSLTPLRPARLPAWHCERGSHH